MQAAKGEGEPQRGRALGRVQGWGLEGLVGHVLAMVIHQEVFKMGTHWARFVLEMGHSGCREDRQGDESLGKGGGRESHRTEADPSPRGGSLTSFLRLLVMSWPAPHSSLTAIA